jgi:UDP-N-acetylglucosamine 2-epimerase (non-hydrolysing)
VSLGTNTIVGLDPTAIRNAVSEVLRGDGKTGTVPPLWDGMASRRAARVIVEFLDQDLATKG